MSCDVTVVQTSERFVDKGATICSKIFDNLHVHYIICKQVTWLVVTEVRSASACGAPWRVLLQHAIMLQCYLWVNLLCCEHYIFTVEYAQEAFSVWCTYSTFGYHLHPLGCRCAKFHFFHDLHCWASPRRKIAYWLTQSLSHSPSLFDAPGTERRAQPFSTQFLPVQGRRPSTTLGTRKLETLGYPTVKTASPCVPSFWHNTGV